MPAELAFRIGLKMLQLTEALLRQAVEVDNATGVIDVQMLPSGYAFCHSLSKVVESIVLFLKTMVS